PAVRRAVSGDQAPEPEGAAARLRRILVALGRDAGEAPPAGRARPVRADPFAAVEADPRPPLPAAARPCARLRDGSAAVELGSGPGAGGSTPRQRGPDERRRPGGRAVRRA